MIPWPQLLVGIKSSPILRNAYAINVINMGPSDVGPYVELKQLSRAPGRYVLPVHAHHIVNGEHLGALDWNYDLAPSIALDGRFHGQYHGRFTQTLQEYGGRGVILTRKELLELYYDIYVEQTGWRELWIIAARTITGSIEVPDPRTFQLK